jgi:hypothetical protein
MFSRDPCDSMTDFQTFCEFHYDYPLKIYLIKASKARNPDNVIASASRFFFSNGSTALSWALASYFSF